MFSIWVGRSSAAHAHTRPGAVRRQGGHRLLAAVKRAIARPESRHQLRFHSRNVCQQPLQDQQAAARCCSRLLPTAAAAALHLLDKTSIAHLLAPLLLLIYYRSELCELSWS